MVQPQFDRSSNGAQDQAARPVPQDVLEAMSREVREAGGEWSGNPEDDNAIGWTAFDSPSSDDGTVTVLLPRENILELPHQSLVRIKSRHPDDRSYLGVVVEGPFAEPDGLRTDSPVVVTATVRGRGNILISNYHGRVQVELLGEELANSAAVPPRRRPLPNSPVFPLSPDEAARVLQTEGEVRLGVAESHDAIDVWIPVSKRVLPRHLGVLGTTGGGKSTTVSGLVQQLQQAGVACVFLDTEGEYTAINQPTEDPQMLSALARRGLSPQGVDHTYIYYPVGRESANPKHPKVRPISLSFAQLSPYSVMEILELNDAQQERFLKAYDATKLAMEQLRLYPTSSADQGALFDLDEMETGHPGMTLTHLYDMVRFIASLVAKEERSPYLETSQFDQNREVLNRIYGQLSAPGNISSWRALQGKVGRVKRLGIFDNPEAKPPDYQAMLQPGRVYIVDLSDTDSPEMRNLAIAQILRGVQRQQEENYQDAIAAGRSPTPVMVFIEEAHEFLSAQRIKDMPVLFQQVARIARRGRKRWLGLAFVTQLPQHLPDEVLGLINNWILHKTNDSNVVNRLRRSIGGIDSSLWGRLPSLAPGQAVVSFTSLARPLLVAVDPTPCKLLMVD